MVKVFLRVIMCYHSVAVAIVKPFPNVEVKGTSGSSKGNAFLRHQAIEVHVTKITKYLSFRSGANFTIALLHVYIKGVVKGL